MRLYITIDTKDNMSLRILGFVLSTAVYYFPETFMVWVFIPITKKIANHITKSDDTDAHTPASHDFEEIQDIETMDDDYEVVKTVIDFKGNKTVITKYVLEKEPKTTVSNFVSYRL